MCLHVATILTLLCGSPVQALGIRVPPGLSASSIAAAVGKDERLPTLDGAFAFFSHAESDTPLNILSLFDTRAERSICAYKENMLEHRCMGIEQV
jgi:hypothetical protein